MDLENHWDLLDAATRFGRSFMQPPTEQDGTKADSSESQEGAATASNAIVKWLDERDVTAFYGKTNASSKQGLSLRIMMALFDERRNDESNTIEAINTLQNLDASKGELLQDDKTIHAKIVEAFFDDRNVIDLGTKSGMEKPVLPLKPYPTEKRLDLIDEDVLFVVLDCETTGLDDKTCHVIQLAGKVLGSDDENDLFSEYILPPIDRIPLLIEELTGITDEFLRNGGYDQALGKERGTARDFRRVYLDFQTFCRERADGRSIVFIAHNAKFDVRMINGELRRWRFSEHAESAPVLGELFTCYLDTLELFRDRKWWKTSYSSGPARPSSFSLSELHSHIFNESIINSHNAVGDIKALERLLLSKPFIGWKTTANEIQVPFVRVDK